MELCSITGNVAQGSNKNPLSLSLPKLPNYFTDVVGICLQSTLSLVSNKCAVLCQRPKSFSPTPLLYLTYR